MFDFSRTFRSVNTDLFFNFSDIFLISPTSDSSDFLLNRAVRAVGDVFFFRILPTFNILNIRQGVRKVKNWIKTHVLYSI